MTIVHGYQFKFAQEARDHFEFATEKEYFTKGAMIAIKHPSGDGIDIYDTINPIMFEGILRGKKEGEVI